MHESVSPVPRALFRAYDIRGVVDQDLTASLVRHIGLAFAATSGHSGPVAVGRDGRLSGPGLSAALIDGLRRGGMDVIDVGQVPTPVVYYAAVTLAGGTGIAITGSHNPPEYNGLKLMRQGVTLYGDMIAALAGRIEAGFPLTDGKGALQTLDLRERYIGEITGTLSLARPLRVAVDCGNGVAGSYAPELLERLGARVWPLYCEVDGHFPNHHPNPSVPENLEAVIRLVREQDLDLGLAFDGDGDRLGVVDRQGRIIWADRLMMLFAADVLARVPQAPILYDVKCSRHLALAIEQAGGQPVMGRTGHSLMKARMRELKAPLAGEMSGHIFFGESWYGFDDALYAAARLLAILSRRPQTPTEVFGALPDSVNTPELNVHFSEEGANRRFVEQLVEAADFPDAVLTTLDGLRVDFPDGWGLVRPSNTTPSLVIRFEADDASALQRIQERFRQVMLHVDPGLSLPF